MGVLAAHSAENGRRLPLRLSGNPNAPMLTRPVPSDAPGWGRRLKGETLHGTPLEYKMLPCLCLSEEECPAGSLKASRTESSGEPAALNLPTPGAQPD